jgi:signal transduction histidine kinase
MKKLLALICLLVCFGQLAEAQLRTIDSLSKKLSITKDDKTKVILLSDIGYYYRLSKPDTAFILCRQALALAKQIQYAEGEANALSSIGSIYRMLGDIQNALYNQYESLRIAEKYGYKNELAKAYLAIGIVHSDIKDYDIAIKYVKQAREIYESADMPFLYNTALANLGEVYFKNNQLDSALHYLQIAHKNIVSNPRATAIAPFTFSRLSMVYLKLNKYDAAYEYAQKAIELGKVDKNIRVQIKGNQITSQYYQSANKIDSAIYYALKALDLSKAYDYKFDVLENSTLLADLYEQKDFKQAYYYAKFSKQLNDSIYGVDRVNALQKKMIQQQEIVREKEAKSLAAQNRMKQNVLLGGLALLCLIGFILYRNNLRKQKDNELLHRQKEEIDFQRNKAEKTLTELQLTQTQLIQKEKLASLGELTAGIAHEIQNPLNFVNNFSELSVDLAKELKEEIEKSPQNTEGGIVLSDKSYIDELLTDLTSNQEKINHHGKRASSIVKGMLEHSRVSTGERQLTDINALCDEYLRLSYHGMRAKDKSFNAVFPEGMPMAKTDFDPHLPKINVVSQDIGRVLLNLMNNAFYAVNERNLRGFQNLEGLKSDYIPSVTVTTQRVDNQIIIKVVDNGNGIPDSIKSKIFQPFFTTKPTGEGTGLGLSLAYDIVTKGHGGTLEVVSTVGDDSFGEGVGSEFIIRLPV